MRMFFKSPTTTLCHTQSVSITPWLTLYLHFNQKIILTVVYGNKTTLAGHNLDFYGLNLAFTEWHF